MSGRHASLVVLFVILFSTVAFACPICFRTDDDHVVSGVRAGVLVMMSVTASVLIVAGVFAHRIAKRQ